MSGLSCCSTNRQDTYTGSQFRRAWDYVQDPLTDTTEIFMNNTIPAGFGPLNVPFLSSVTALAGTGFNYLASVPTIPLQTPYAVDILFGSSDPQRWFLIAGTSGGGAGICLPNDYNPASNAKYWVQLT